MQNWIFNLFQWGNTCTVYSVHCTMHREVIAKKKKKKIYGKKESETETCIIINETVIKTRYHFPWNNIEFYDVFTILLLDRLCVMRAFYHRFCCFISIFSSKRYNDDDRNKCDVLSQPRNIYSVKENENGNWKSEWKQNLTKVNINATWIFWK